MLDTVSGLPVHALVLHAAVVLLPLMALLTLAFTLRPRWRSGLPWVILGNLVTLGAVYATVESGEKLQSRLNAAFGRETAVDHGELGASLPYFAIALLVASVLAYLLVGRAARRGRSSADWDDTDHRPARASIPAVILAVTLVLVSGAAATAWTVRVGDSGAKAVWEDTIANTETPAGN